MVEGYAKLNEHEMIHSNCFEVIKTGPILNKNLPRRQV